MATCIDTGEKIQKTSLIYLSTNTLAISLSEKYIPHLIFDDCFLQTQLWHSGPPTNF